MKAMSELEIAIIGMTRIEVECLLAHQHLAPAHFARTSNIEQTTANNEILNNEPS